MNSLVANYGPALIDRALLDALCRATGQSFAAVVRANQIGLAPGELCPDLAGFDLGAFLGRAAARVDDPGPPHRRPGRPDPRRRRRRPVSTTACPRRWRRSSRPTASAGSSSRWPATSRPTSSACAASPRCSTRIAGGYHATLDGNEQYRDVDGVIALWQRMRAEPRLARLCDSVVFIEQPIQRGAALAHDVTALSTLKPVIIDESDDSLDAFVTARDLGYRGVSSKTCKGLYKSILNAARCRHWNRQAGAARFLMSAEDLTIQAGLALQQDLALVSLLGITHVERNGHHYVNGMADLPAAEQAPSWPRTPTCTTAPTARCACASRTARCASVRSTASVSPAARRPTGRRWRRCG